jgi:hypothetical protein
VRCSSDLIKFVSLKTKLTKSRKANFPSSWPIVAESVRTKYPDGKERVSYEMNNWPQMLDLAERGFCDICQSALKQISEVLFTPNTEFKDKVDWHWRPNNMADCESLPSNIIKHRSGLASLPGAARTCSLCELIRVGFLLSIHFQDSSLLDSNDVRDIIQDDKLNMAFAGYLSTASVYLGLLHSSQSFHYGDNVDFIFEGVRVHIVRGIQSHIFDLLACADKGECTFRCLILKA